MTAPRAMLVAVLLLSACAAGKNKELAAQRALGDELVRRGEWDAALRVVAPIVRDHPDDAEALLLRGLIYTEKRLLSEATADLEESVARAPKSSRAHSALAIVYDIHGRSKDALDHHKRAVELEPRNSAYLNNLGFSLFASGRPRDAIPFLHEALRSTPADARIRNNLGFAYAAAGDFARAAEHFNLAGGPAEAKNNLGWAYERRGALPQAFDSYVEALRLDPGSAAAKENLLRVATQLGRPIPDDLSTPKNS